MAKRGKRATKINNGPGKRTRQDIRRALRKAGTLERLHQWCEEEKRRVDDEEAMKRFDDAILPMLALQEEDLWKHQRTPEANRINKQRDLEQGVKTKVTTREENIRMTIKPLVSQLRKLGSGQSENAIVGRLIRKLRDGYKPPS